MTPLKVYIGYDGRESVCYHVLAHSILTRASGPVQICPIMLSQLDDVYRRPRNPGQSTDFTFARFLTPYLAGPGISIFMDSDMLCLSDVYELEKLAKEQPYSDVLVVKHDYLPKAGKKFLDQKQSQYRCKNWSSLMVFNGHRLAIRNLTPQLVNSMTPMELHQFEWARDVGEIPSEWNHLVGEYEPRSGVKIAHYTLGAPCFRKYQNCEYAQEWFQELGRMTYCHDPDTGGSYHDDLSGCANEDRDRFPESH